MYKTYEDNEDEGDRLFLEKRSGSMRKVEVGPREDENGIDIDRRSIW